jgi:hypothetical protein
MTVRNWKAWEKCPPANADCHWDWGKLKGAFGGKIMPTDWDGVVERHGRFLVFETKIGDAPIPTGQRIALRAAVDTGFFTVCVLWIDGNSPRKMQIITKGSAGEIDNITFDIVYDFCRDWYEWADGFGRDCKLPQKTPLDISFFEGVVSSDVDGFLDFNGKFFAFFQLQHKTQELKYSQLLALQRLADTVAKVKPAVSIIASHTAEPGEMIDAAGSIVRRYRYKGKWFHPQKQTTLREAVEKFLVLFDANGK